MQKKLTRRDFLQLTGLSLATLAGARFITDSKWARVDPGEDQPNVILILFDTLSARHLSLYGYPRKTTPNLAKFARNAIVYRSHHSAANYTVPSTASLLTGTYPWMHRGYFGIPRRDIAEYGLFRWMGDAYYRAGFSQNLLSDMILYQFAEDLDLHVDSDAFTEISSPAYRLINRLFSNDGLSAILSSEGYYFANKNKAGSIFLSLLDKLSVQARYKYRLEYYEKTYLRGLPHIWLHNVFFDQRTMFDGVMSALDEIPNPSLTYLHFWSPHEPYQPSKKFIGMFKDDLKPVEKEEHFFSHSFPQDQLNGLRRQYDEYIAHIDDEFGRLIQHLEETGLLDNSYVIVTSDHGQLFERGVHGHVTELMYEPLLHIPLIISTPAGTGREEITTPTSNVDIFPSLLHLAGQPIPEWCEGQLLPGLGGQADDERSLYSVEAKDNPAYMPLEKASVVLYKGRYKLIHYFGYPGHEDEYELYDLVDDPEELENLYSPTHPIGQAMQSELDQKIKEVNQIGL